ncbi:MAG: hypothetical protein H9535_08755 [Ignavibacteria bacterium]|nr:hypothetical protein [Ignavibacteria bacterium]
MKTKPLCLLSLAFILIFSASNNVCYSQAASNTTFADYHPPYSVGKWEIQENGITTIPCYIQRANITRSFRGNAVDIAEIAFTQGIEFWNAILQASNIPIRLNGIITSNKESDAFNNMSTENIFIISNKITPIIPQTGDIVYGFTSIIEKKYDSVFVGRQKFIKYKANHIELNRDAFDKDYLRIGVGDPTRTTTTNPKQNICYVAAHEIGHFLGINRHFVSSNSGTIMHVANILPPSALIDCDCDNIVSKVNSFVSLEKDLIKGLYPALFLTSQHQNDDCIPQSTRPAPVKP